MNAAFNTRRSSFVIKRNVVIVSNNQSNNDDMTKECLRTIKILG